MSLPLNVPKRGLSLDEAAEYCGVSRNSLTRHGPAPIKIGDRTIYDRRGLDRWLDQLAGLPGNSAAEAVPAFAKPLPLPVVFQAAKRLPLTISAATAASTTKSFRDKRIVTTGLIPFRR